MGFKNDTIKDGLTNDFGLSIYENRNKLLWFGMLNGSLAKLNGVTLLSNFNICFVHFCLYTRVNKQHLFNQ